MISMGRIAEATDLAVEFISAVLGKGMANFDLKYPLVPTSPSTWLPINILEWLLLELEHASENDDAYIEVITNSVEFGQFLMGRRI